MRKFISAIFLSFIMLFGCSCASASTSSVDNAVYHISYQLNGGSWEEGYTPFTSYNASSPTFSIPNLSLKTKIWKGWSLSADLSNPQTDFKIRKGMTGDLTLYAVFENYEVFKITFTTDYPDPSRVWWSSKDSSDYGYCSEISDAYVLINEWRTPYIQFLDESGTIITPTRVIPQDSKIYDICNITYYTAYYFRIMRNATITVIVNQ